MKNNIMEKQLKSDYRAFDITEGITIEEFNDKYSKLLKEIKDKHGYITDVKIHAECDTYNDGEDYYEKINIEYKHYETDEEFERRKNWHESMAIIQKENDLKRLKEYIEKYPDIATKYMNELIKN